MKTGPTIIKPEYRRLGIGVAARRALYRRLERRGVRHIYCTCPASAGGVVHYLLDSGMKIEACLKHHLRESGDELVLARELSGVSGQQSTDALRMSKSLGDVRVDWPGPATKACESAVGFFVSHLEKWYFESDEGLRERLLASFQTSLSTEELSEKPRLILTMASQSRRTRACIVVTSKRSSMLKVNYVASTEGVPAFEAGMKALLLLPGNWRRVYMTMPVQRVATVLAAKRLGFSFEGVLSSPFQAGVDHVCLGKNSK